MARWLLSDLARAARLSPRTWLDLARATLELAIARRQLVARTARELLASSHGGKAAAVPRSLDQRQQRLVTRVAFAVPRMGTRAPWRSDCLVQALAARHWLEAGGISSELCIGVRQEDVFEAHAWLRAGDVIVTGGDISSFVPLE